MEDVNLHEKPKDILENSEKIAELVRKVENLQTVTNKNEPKKDAEHGKETREKFTIMEKKFETISKAFEEKIKGIEEHFEKKIYDLEKTVKQQQAKIENVKVDIQSMEIEKELIKYEKCDFTTTSEKGVKTHMKRKHPVEIITFKCEFVTMKQKEK